MFTVCPKCALTLVVTAADLRVAQGYVRCGRCSSVFNALAQLSDERGAARGPEAPPAESRPEEPAEPQEPPADSLEFNPESTDASSVFVAPSPSPEWTAATGSFKSLVAANQEPVTPGSPPGEEAKDVDVDLDLTLLSDIVHGEPPQSAPPPPPSNVAAEPRPAGLAPGTPAVPVMPAWTELALERETLPGADGGFGAWAPREPVPAPQATRGPLLWSVGVALLALILVAQLINHRRDVLATDPRLTRALTALYAAFGVQLTPRWDLHAYDVRQLGATVGQGSQGAITVRASLRNVGVRPQPLPLLRVTLQDRFGNRLASRDVQPRDYLPRGIPPTALLGTDQRIDAELAFVDPGAAAVGFELDACLPLAGGGVACTNDASAR
jgi:predicted Zn finger-like uncharacterized protein